MKILFSGYPMPEAVNYQVKDGESLGDIAKRFHTTIDLIKKSNALRDNTIHAGMRLKVLKKRFWIKADKSENTLTLYMNREIWKEYKVATGTDNNTPTGKFKIATRLINPTWFKGPGVVIAPRDPNNDLGTRWMGFKDMSYGIHGTTEPETLGTQASAGCIRMRNRDVEELFTLIPLGTKVIIQD